MSNEIKDFWDNKINYTTPEQLIEKIEEYFRADFIENYSKWKKNIDEFNEDAIYQLAEVGMPMTYWSPMTYDNFCHTIISMVKEWINTNKDIQRRDMKVIIEKLFSEHLGQHLKVWEENMYTMEGLLNSIKKTIAVQSNAKQ